MVQLGGHGRTKPNADRTNAEHPFFRTHTERFPNAPHRSLRPKEHYNLLSPLRLRNRQSEATPTISRRVRFLNVRPNSKSARQIEATCHAIKGLTIGRKQQRGTRIFSHRTNRRPAHNAQHRCATGSASAWVGNNKQRTGANKALAEPVAQREKNKLAQTNRRPTVGPSVPMLRR